MPQCTTCHIEINSNYCSRCGKKQTEKRLTVWNIGADFLDNFFAVDNSFVSQMREMLVDPKRIIQDYWDGGRRFYFSPGRFLLIATIFLGFNFLLTNNKFLGFGVSVGSHISLTIAFFLIFLPFFSLSSFLVYFKFKKNFTEHLVMNIYNLGFWVILFSIISALLIYIDLPKGIETGFQIPFSILVVFWNARCFEMKTKWRIIYSFLNLLVIFGFFWAIFAITNFENVA